MKFTRDRWYSRDGQRQLQQRARNESLGTRRIISLTLLLLMVLVVMKQLQDPKKYAPAFQAIGLAQTAKTGPASLDASQSNPPSNALSVASHAAAIDAGHSSDNPQTSELSFARHVLSINPETTTIDLYSQMWDRLFESASLEALSEIARSEFSPPSQKRTGASDAFLAWLASSQLKVETWQREYQNRLASNSTDTRRETSEIELGMTFVSQWNAWSNIYRDENADRSMSFDVDCRSGMRIALDQRLMKLAMDATPWRPRERPMLARTLQRANLLADSIHSNPAVRSYLSRFSPTVEIASLLKQTNEYRGQSVRFIGQSVTNAEPTVQDIEGWGRFEYDVVWLRPLHGSQQPICVYALRRPSIQWPIIATTTTSSPAESSNQKKSLEGIDASDVPYAELSGILLKRLAYPSQRGVDLAPVLVVYDVRWPRSSELDEDIVPSAGFRKIRSRRWIEPGEQAVNLQLLSDIFATDLASLSDESTRSILTDTSRSIEAQDVSVSLERVLYQLPRVAKALEAAVDTGETIGPARLSSLRGWVRSIEPIQLRDSPATRGESKTIYRLQIETHANPANDSSNATIEDPVTHIAFVNHVPSHWISHNSIKNQKSKIKNSVHVSQPVTLAGIAIEASANDAKSVYWMADHVEWSWRWLAETEPVNTSKSSDLLSPKIPEDWERLGALGFDLSRIDLIRNLRGKSLTGQEKHAFYSLIDCGERWSTADVPPSQPTFSAIDCLQEANPPLLRGISARVNIVRATRILVNDASDQSILDDDGYYELDGLANLGDLSIQLKSPNGKEHVLFQGEFPITLISKHIPAWLAEGAVSSASSDIVAERREPSGSAEVTRVSPDGSRRSATNDSNSSALPATWYPRRSVDIEGIFYRLWSFDTAQTAALNRKEKSDLGRAAMKQIGPLVAVTKWERPIDRDAPAEPRSIVRKMIVREIGVLVALAAIGIYVLYRWNQPVKRRKT